MKCVVFKNSESKTRLSDLWGHASTIICWVYPPIRSKLDKMFFKIPSWHKLFTRTWIQKHFQDFLDPFCNYSHNSFLSPMRYISKENSFSQNRYHQFKYHTYWPLQNASSQCTSRKFVTSAASMVLYISIRHNFALFSTKTFPKVPI